MRTVEAQIRAPANEGFPNVLTPDALDFLGRLHREVEPTRLERLAWRAEMAEKLRNGGSFHFLAGTADTRDSAWRVADVPQDLRVRKVEITGPTDRKMVINALNSGASVYMADFEDANTPTWHNMVDGQQNLIDAVNGTISFKNPDGREYKLAEKTATLVVRPRGWHLVERHLTIDGAPISGAVFDFGLYVFHNAAERVRRATAPYFYLPKMESHLEARLWNDVFLAAQDALGLARGTIKATVLIETILAAFEMDEILHELREHSAGLNCGRWDYIFSVIKTLRNRADWMVPDRLQVTMDKHFLDKYSKLLCETTHKRGAQAMGGMAAFIPVKNNEELNQQIFAKVRTDKLREVKNGHDGTWVAHPGLVGIAKEIFDREMPQANQIACKRQDVHVTASDLLAVPKGTITEAGLRQNLNVGIGYIEAWLRGIGCVPLYNLMEDAATAEISRAQIWQWVRHGARLDDGRTIDAALCRKALDEELIKLRETAGSPGRYEDAAELFRKLIEAPAFPEFLTMPAYDMITSDIT